VLLSRDGSVSRPWLYAKGAPSYPVDCRSVIPDVLLIVVQSFLVAVTAVRIRSDAIAELFGHGRAVSSEKLADFKTNVCVSCAPLVLTLSGASGKRADCAIFAHVTLRSGCFWQRLRQSQCRSPAC
jgi:hypothetical protein